MHQRSRFASVAATLLLAFPSVPAQAQTSDLEQHLRDRYKGKTLLLRGFYSGDQLHYDSATAPTGGAASGDWTVNGFVLVDDIRISGQHLAITATRMVVGSRPLHFLADTPEKRKNKKRAPFLKIDAELGPGSPAAEQADAAISRIFLTAQDHFAELVPDYWRPCISEGFSGKNAACRFTPEFTAIPGLTSSAEVGPTPITQATENASDIVLAHRKDGVSPPKPIVTPDPKFSKAARAVGLQGTVTLGLIVNKEGTPTKIHIVSPLGCGLDENAVHAVEGWKFKPAEKDGQPVNVEIAVEVEFHLY
jgi:TonB family protein